MDADKAYNDLHKNVSIPFLEALGKLGHDKKIINGILIEAAR
jgi:hypothetical protein